MGVFSVCNSGLHTFLLVRKFYYTFCILLLLILSGVRDVIATLCSIKTAVSLLWRRGRKDILILVSSFVKTICMLFFFAVMLIYCVEKRYRFHNFVEFNRSGHGYLLSAFFHFNLNSRCKAIFCILFLFSFFFLFRFRFCFVLFTYF